MLAPLWSRMSGIALAMLALVVVIYPATAQEAAKPLAPIEDKPGLPRVLLLGDSISIGYTLPVRELLKGKANVHRARANCGATTQGLRELDRWLGRQKWDVIHFNWGLHDIKYIDEKGDKVDIAKGRQVNPIRDYEANLRSLVRRLKQTKTRLIWCSTTPAPEGSPGRVPADVEKYNAVAAKIMAEAEIETDDLYTFVASYPDPIQKPQDVHFTSEGYGQLAKQVAKSIESVLAQTPNQDKSKSSQ